jgi:hypothetical protein
MAILGIFKTNKITKEMYDLCGRYLGVGRALKQFYQL